MMDACYGFVQTRLTEERAYAAQARLARLARRSLNAADADGSATPFRGLRERIGHALVSIGEAVEGTGASHPHAPAGRVR